MVTHKSTKITPNSYQSSNEQTDQDAKQQTFTDGHFPSRRKSVSNRWQADMMVTNSRQLVGDAIYFGEPFYHFEMLGESMLIG